MVAVVFVVPPCRLTVLRTTWPEQSTAENLSGITVVTTRLHGTVRPFCIAIAAAITTSPTLMHICPEYMLVCMHAKIYH